ncbi:MAG: UDP-N-acetylmuramoyl-tripeptide--D-alanyl-D-alanine ligase [Oscillospiraceae bacterium]|nr:UDP-N-acetylmuramoyl-tripeptide--D-alanyl-D-alanine ligase [Oscillospiraceae bacterium]
MTGLSLITMAAACGGTYMGDRDLAVRQPNEIVIDSRVVVEGNLFCALPGEKVDGHKFVSMAFDKGAAACLVTHVPEGETRPCIVVEDVVAAMGDIAAAYRATLQIPIVGITGSVGKTTMKEMIASILEQRFAVLKTDKNYNNHMGVPMTLSRINPKHRAAVVEMGINHFGEMEYLAKIVRPNVAVFTNIGRCHLEFLGDRYGVFLAKTEMMPYIKAGGSVFVCGDDDLLARYDYAGLDVFTFGTKEDCVFHAENVVVHGKDGISCDIVCFDRRIPVTIHAYGKHMILAALGAAAVCMNFGMSDADIAAGIAAYQPVGGRAAVIETGKLTVINDCYNANPDSMKSAIESLAMCPGRKVAVLGDMYELGTESVSMHREMGEVCCREGIDKLIACGELGVDIAAAAKEAGMTDVIHFADRESLERAICTLVQDGDYVLVKASHGLHLEAVVEALQK